MRAKKKGTMKIDLDRQRILQGKSKQASEITSKRSEKGKFGT